MLGLRHALWPTLKHSSVDGINKAAERLFSSSRACSSVLWAQGVSNFPESVHIVDPRAVLNPDKEAKLSSVQLELPQALLKEPPHFELGDADDPMSTWIFGKRAEIFQYKFLGPVAVQSGLDQHLLPGGFPAAQQHRQRRSGYALGRHAQRDQGSVATQSGWVSILSQEAFRQLNSAGSSGQAPQWDALRSAAEASDGLLTNASPSREQPFSFVGQILEAGTASVYSRQEKGAITGLLIATGEEELQTP